jgi:serine/threonine protein phosphatase 1
LSNVVYYAIGDVHGLAERLRDLHHFILEDQQRHGAPVKIVHLGDYIDRGPASREALQQIMALSRYAAQKSDISVEALRGNHEQMLLDAYDSAFDGADRQWFGNGGYEALSSYTRAHDLPNSAADWRSAIDAHHVAWLRERPLMLHDPERRIVFTHAGIDPQTFPACTPEVLIWTRSQRFFDPMQWPVRAELDGLLVVHGHTPTRGFHPEELPRRINVDTGAVYGGVLTCAVLAPGERPRYLHA